MKDEHGHVYEKRDGAVLKMWCDIAKTIGLEEWTLQVGDRPTSKGEDGYDPMAEVEVTPHRRLATICLAPDFVGLGHRVILHTLLHEALHLYFTDQKQAIADLSEYRVLGNEAHSVLQMTMSHYEEISVDQMAKAWADIMWEWDSVQKHLRKITRQVERTTP